MAMDWSGDPVIRRDDNVLGAEVNDQIALMNPKMGRYYTLDAIGADIWRRMAQPINANELINTVCADYRGDPARIAVDIRELLDKMAEHGLVVGGPSSSP